MTYDEHPKENLYGLGSIDLWAKHSAPHCAPTTSIPSLFKQRSLFWYFVSDWLHFEHLPMDISQIAGVNKSCRFLLSIPGRAQLGHHDITVLSAVPTPVAAQVSPPSEALGRTWPGRTWPSIPCMFFFCVICVPLYKKRSTRLPYTTVT